MNKDTLKALTSQDKTCGSDFFSLLPPEFLDEVNSLMRKHKALTRQRVIREGTQLLFFALLYVLRSLSLRGLSALAAQYNCSMADTAWRKRLIQSNDAFGAILTLALRWAYPMQPSPSVDNLVIRIVDRTSVCTQGKAREYRIHTRCDLPLRRIEELKITDHHTAEALTLYSFGENDLVVADSGYARTRQLEAIYAKADFLLRFSPYCITFWRAERKVDFYALLKDRSEPFEPFQFRAQIKKHGPLVRIVALPIPQEAWEGIMKRKKDAARKRQTKKPDPRNEVFSRWTLLVTSLHYSVSIEQIGNLYTLRWQIEILFRDMKDALELHHIKPCSDALATAILTLKLTAWVMAQYALHQLTPALPRRQLPRLSPQVFIKHLLLWLDLAICRSFPDPIPLSFPPILYRLLDHNRTHPSPKCSLSP